MKMNSMVSLFLGFVLSVVAVSAEIKVASVLGDNMVLQRNAVVKLWGKASPNKKMSVKTEWNNVTFSTTCKENGDWDIKVKTTDAGGPYTIQISQGEDKVLLKNILLGEVWVCSGQSNMEMPISGYGYQPILGSADALLDADNSQIRLFTVKKSAMDTPQDTCGGSWLMANAESVGKFSAVGYFYAKLLQQKLNVPVGMIFSSVGGTRIESWMSDEAMKSFPEATKKLSKISKKEQQPTKLYNGMIHPIINYTIKGVIWYQGESNRNDYQDYAKLLPVMVDSWRNDFGLGLFPFYYVQIAPYAYNDCKALQSSFLREAQFKALFNIPNSGMVCTLDLGNEHWIHPSDKAPVAKRLALYALSETYNFKGLPYKSPIYKSMAVTDSIVTLNFDNAETGMTTYDKGVDCFEIAGRDSVFYPAKLIPLNNENRKVQIVSSKVKTPVAVRYAFQNFPKTEGYLYNTAGLPLFPFRTDTWQGVKTKN
jgi:sialate O-acetylesterase